MSTAAIPFDTRPATIHDAVEWDMPSALSGRTYRVFLAIPAAPPPLEGYPVYYITDGNIQFAQAAIHTQLLAAMSKESAIVVGVGHPENWHVVRSRDFTAPTPASALPERIRKIFEAPEAEGPYYGGATEFRRFLVEELRPAIGALHPIDEHRQTLAGYSLGGLFTLLALAESPQSFSAYAALSPSVWWNDREVLQNLERLKDLPAAERERIRVLITIGGLEQTPSASDSEEVRVSLENSRMVDNARELSDTLGGMGLGAVEFHVFEDETHLSAISGSVVRGLEFALRTPPPSPVE